VRREGPQRTAHQQSGSQPQTNPDWMLVVADRPATPFSQLLRQSIAFITRIMPKKPEIDGDDLHLVRTGTHGPVLGSQDLGQRCLAIPDPPDTP
jgi:hypothetical protein